MQQFRNNTALRWRTGLTYTQNMETIRQIFSRNLNTILDIEGFPRTGLGRVSRVAELFGMSRANAQKWLSGGTLPDPGRYKEIAERLHCSLDDLFLAGGPGSRVDPNDGRQPMVVLTRFGTQLVTTSPALAASLGWVPGVMALEVADSGMEPFVMPGDYVIFDPNPMRYSGDGVYVLYTNGHYSARRIQELSSGNIRVNSEGRWQHAEEIDSSQIEFGLPVDPKSGGNIYIVGPVIGRLLVRR